jgi:hypothetical protein
MCTADTGVHPFVWAGKGPHVYPDFEREYKCKNFEDIREYAKMHQVSYMKMDLAPEEGALILEKVP